MNAQDFDFVAQLVRGKSGLVLAPEKAYLVESRLSPLARREGLPSVEELIRVTRARRDPRMIEAIVDAMTTNETFFFRDKTPFDLLRDEIMPGLQARRTAGQRLRIWCAACSTGQEPYSIAMMADDNPNLFRAGSLEIVGTDISERVLEKAKAGLYSQFEVQRGLPIQMLMKNFDKDGDVWKVKDALRARIQFRAHNLLESMVGLGKFDVVFCRNVLIYLDTPTRRDVLGRIAAQMAPDGYLVLGAAETVIGVTDAFQPAKGRRGLYVRPGSAAAEAA